MLWHELLLPAALIAMVVRLDAIFLGPYWSWLQLIPDAFNSPEPTGVRRLRRRALARRIAIPGLMAALLVLVWPDTYSPMGAGFVTLAAAGLLLWPFVFASDWRVVHQPWQLAVVLYVLLLILFAAVGYLGGAVAATITSRGGVLEFVRDEAVSVLLTAVVLLFTRDALDRVAGRLQSTAEEIE